MDFFFTQATRARWTVSLREIMWLNPRNGMNSVCRKSRKLRFWHIPLIWPSLCLASERFDKPLVTAGRVALLKQSLSRKTSLQGAKQRRQGNCSLRLLTGVILNIDCKHVVNDWGAVICSTPINMALVEKTQLLRNTQMQAVWQWHVC